MTESSLLPRKKRARRGVRYQMELNFDTEEAKQALLSRMDHAKRYLAPRASFLDNAQLLSLVLDKVDLEAASSSRSGSHQEKAQTDKQPAMPMLENSGLCI